MPCTAAAPGGPPTTTDITRTDTYMAPTVAAPGGPPPAMLRTVAAASGCTPPTMPPQAGTTAAPGCTPPTMPPQAGTAAAPDGPPPRIQASWQSSTLLAQRYGPVWLPVGLTQCCKQGPDAVHMLRRRLDGELQQGVTLIQVGACAMWAPHVCECECVCVYVDMCSMHVQVMSCSSKSDCMPLHADLRTPQDLE